MEKIRFYVTNFRDVRINADALQRRMSRHPSFAAFLAASLDRSAVPPFFNFHLGRVKVLNLEAFLMEGYVEYDDVSRVGDFFREGWLACFAQELKGGEACFCLDDDDKDEVHYRIRPGYIELWNPDEPGEAPRPLDVASLAA